MKYETLKGNPIILDGDEYDFEGKWQKCDLSVGMTRRQAMRKFNELRPFTIRRPLKYKAAKKPAANSTRSKLIKRLEAVLPTVKNGMSTEEIYKIRGCIADALDQLRPYREPLGAICFLNLLEEFVNV